jgi:hypothetical protein
MADPNISRPQGLAKDDFVKTFVPRKQPLPPMDLDSYELVWM